MSAGIPGVNQIARNLLLRLSRDHYQYDPELISAANQQGQFHRLVNQHYQREGKQIAYDDDSKINWWQLYSHIFTDHLKTANEQRKVFNDLIVDSGGAINWGHLCLAELVRLGYCSTVITTNFDQLVLDGLTRVGVIPVICDGIESLNRISGKPLYPQLVQIHGSRHTYSLRNSIDDIDELNKKPQFITSIRELFSSLKILVVVGYGGNESWFSNLVEVYKDYPDKEVYWIAYGEGDSFLADKVKIFLSVGENARVMYGQDADQFFAELMQVLKLGAPQMIREPLKPLVRQIQAICQKESAGESLSFAKSRINTFLKTAENELDHLDQALLQFRRGQSLSTQALSKINQYLAEGEFDEIKPLLEQIQETVNLFEIEDKFYQEGKRLGHRGLIQFSIEANDKILQQVDRELNAENWANAQNNKGNALAVLGEQRGDEKVLQAAIDAYELALEERTRDKMPMDWAMTQNNKAIALAVLGKQHGDEEALQAAINAFELALGEWTRDKMPMNWASTQNNKGAALQVLGEQRGDEEALQAAINAYELALEEVTQDNVPAYCEIVLNNRENAQTILKKLQKSNGNDEE